MKHPEHISPGHITNTNIALPRIRITDMSYRFFVVTRNFQRLPPDNKTVNK